MQLTFALLCLVGTIIGIGCNCFRAAAKSHFEDTLSQFGRRKCSLPVVLPVVCTVFVLIIVAGYALVVTTMLQAAKLLEEEFHDKLQRSSTQSSTARLVEQVQDGHAAERSEALESVTWTRLTARYTAAAGCSTAGVLASIALAILVMRVEVAYAMLAADVGLNSYCCMALAGLIGPRLKQAHLDLSWVGEVVRAQRERPGVLGFAAQSQLDTPRRPRVWVALALAVVVLEAVPRAVTEPCASEPDVHINALAGRAAIPWVAAAQLGLVLDHRGRYSSDLEIHRWTLIGLQCYSKIRTN